MHLYCQCGYPFLVTAVWTGRDYYLVLRDCMRGKASPPIIHCPQRDQGLVLEHMAQQPPTNVVRWHAKSEPPESSQSQIPNTLGSGE